MLLLCYCEARRSKTKLSVHNFQDPLTNLAGIHMSWSHALAPEDPPEVRRGSRGFSHYPLSASRKDKGNGLSRSNLSFTLNPIWNLRNIWMVPLPRKTGWVSSRASADSFLQNCYCDFLFLSHNSFLYLEYIEIFVQTHIRCFISEHFKVSLNLPSFSFVPYSFHCVQK